jgi:hypothetical protein
LLPARVHVPTLFLKSCSPPAAPPLLIAPLTTLLALVLAPSSVSATVEVVVPPLMGPLKTSLSPLERTVELFWNA